jgi:FkbM family methyltransferase
MLMLRNFEMPIIQNLDGIPEFMRRHYVLFLLEAVNVLNAPGEVERVVDYLFALTEFIHDRGIRRNGVADRSDVQKLCGSYLISFNCIQAYFSPRNLRQLYVQRGDLASAVLVAAGSPTLHALTPRRQIEGKIRLGIFAQHFGPQTETYFTLSHFNHLDRSVFDITLYCLDQTRHPLEQRCIARSDRLTLLPRGDPSAQARRIREDGLDILLISSNMTSVMSSAFLLGAFRMAPIQVASVSSPVTTGARHVDVLLSAEWNEPDADATQHYHERLVLMPGSVNYYSYQYDTDPASIAPTRADWGVAPGTVVMFSGANFFKITPELSRAWMRVLAAVPDSVLVLMPYNPNWLSSYQRRPFIARIQQQAREVGIDPARVKIIDSVPTRADVHRVLALADVYLDAYPFAGACSLLDPIIVGVPPVVWTGTVGRSSHGASLMRMVGLEELISDSEDGFVALAVDLATNPAKRECVRSALRVLGERRPPIYFDTAVFSHRVGEALRGLCERKRARYDRLARVPLANRRQALQRLADSVVGTNFELNQLTDIGLVTALIEPFFRSLPGNHRHLVDVGACYGSMAQPLLERGWTADLFEPDPDARAILKRNLGGRARQCRIHAVAVNNTTDTEVVFHKSRTNGCSGLGDSPFAPTSATMKVPCTSLARCYVELGITAVDFLKIDAEGFDFDVLESHDFHALQPRLILIEYGTFFARQTLDVINAAIARMATHGYGAVVFNYTADGDFKKGEWSYRLTEMLVDTRVPNFGREAFGNILFYRHDDTHFALTLYALLETCSRPTDVAPD